MGGGGPAARRYEWKRSRRVATGGQTGWRTSAPGCGRRAARAHSLLLPLRHKWTRSCVFWAAEGLARLVVCARGRLSFGARRAATTLCGVSRQPGASRRACRSSRAAGLLLRRSAASWRTQERRGDGGPGGAGGTGACCACGSAVSLAEVVSVRTVGTRRQRDASSAAGSRGGGGAGGHGGVSYTAVLTVFGGDEGKRCRGNARRGLLPERQTLVAPVARGRRKARGSACTPPCSTIARATRSRWTRWGESQFERRNAGDAERGFAKSMLLTLSRSAIIPSRFPSGVQSGYPIFSGVSLRLHPSS